MQLERSTTAAAAVTSTKFGTNSPKWCDEDESQDTGVFVVNEMADTLHVAACLCATSEGGGGGGTGEGVGLFGARIVPVS